VTLLRQDARAQQLSEIAEFAALGPDLTQKGDVATYAPVYLLFPEGQPGDAPPHPKGERDYHPRSVEMYLEDSRIHYRRRWVTYVKWIWYAAIIALVAGIPTGLLALVLDQPWWNDGFFLILYVIPLLVLLLENVRGPKGVAGIRAALENGIEKGIEDGLRSRRLVLEAGASSFFLRLISAAAIPVAAWDRYTGIVASPGSEFFPLTVYARIAPASDPADRVIQYWTFYYYNHWENEHPADWECIQLFFADGREAPVAAVYSNHLGGTWRLWDDVPKLKDGSGKDTSHPVVYVALGSHAQYFGPKDIGYEAPFALRIPTILQFIKARIVGVRSARSARERDHVVLKQPVSVDEITASYSLRDAPEDLLAVDPFIPNGPAWQPWWWLRFNGAWAGGGLQPIHGPATQEDKWDRSWDWVVASGQADADWADAFRSSRG
jgi:hypothetical protein